MRLIDETRRINPNLVRLGNRVCKISMALMQLLISRLLMAPSFRLSVVILFALRTLTLFISKIRFNHKYRYPNVVPGWPLIGNTLDVPYPAGMFTRELTKKYGEM